MSTFPRPIKKGQVSLEFLVTISLALLVFTLFYSVISTKQTQAMESAQKTRAETVAQNIAYQLDIVLSQGTNFSKIFKLPLTISNVDYTITLETTANNFTHIEISVPPFKASAISAAPQVSGNLTPGTNTLTNEGGVIYANQ